MRALALVLSLSTGLGIGAWGIGACGSDSGSDAPPAGGTSGTSASTSGTSPPSSSGASASSGGTPLPGTDSGGGTSGSTDSGGGTSGGVTRPTDPGFVSCDAVECDAGVFAGCCFQNDGGPHYCAPAGGFPAGFCGPDTHQIICDEPGDCDQSLGYKTWCCADTRPPQSSSCGKKACAPDELALCKRSEDCDGGPCQVVKCAGKTFLSCTKPSYCE